MLIFLIGFLIFTILLLFIITSAFLGFLFTRVPFVPTGGADIEPMVKRLGINNTHQVFELGSGNGKVVFLIEKYTGAKVKGFESTLWTHLWAVIKKYITGSKAELVYGNFYKHSWQDADFLYMYLYPPLMPQLAEKAKTDCRPGTTIISRDFPNSHLNQIDYFKTPSGHEMYVYQI